VADSYVQKKYLSKIRELQEQLQNERDLKHMIKVNHYFNQRLSSMDSQTHCSNLDKSTEMEESAAISKS
jgi:hypothetical protein